MGLGETTEGVLSRVSGYHRPSRPITAVVVKVAAVGYGPLLNAKDRTAWVSICSTEGANKPTFGYQEWCQDCFGFAVA